MNEIDTITYTVDAVNEDDIHNDEIPAYILYRGPNISDAFAALGEARERADIQGKHSFVGMRIWDDRQGAMTTLVWERF